MEAANVRFEQPTCKQERIQGDFSTTFERAGDDSMA